MANERFWHTLLRIKSTTALVAVVFIGEKL